MWLWLRWCKLWYFFGCTSHPNHHWCCTSQCLFVHVGQIFHRSVSLLFFQLLKKKTKNIQIPHILPMGKIFCIFLSPLNIDGLRIVNPLYPELYPNLKGIFFFLSFPTKWFITYPLCHLELDWRLLYTTMIGLSTGPMLKNTMRIQEKVVCSSLQCLWTTINAKKGILTYKSLYMHADNAKFD